MYTKHRIDRDGHWQQFCTQPILISAPQWACWPCNAPTWFYTVGKKPSVKADLAIYSQAVDVRVRCMSESLKLGHNLDFSSCDIMVGFHKSSYISYYCQSGDFSTRNNCIGHSIKLTKEPTKNQLYKLKNL